MPRVCPQKIELALADGGVYEFLLRRDGQVFGSTSNSPRTVSKAKDY